MLTQIDNLNSLITLKTETQFEKFGFKIVEIDISNLKKLGEGNFGSIYLYEDSNKREYVLKIIDIG